MPSNSETHTTLDRLSPKATRTIEASYDTKSVNAKGNKMGEQASPAALPVRLRFGSVRSPKLPNRCPSSLSSNGLTHPKSRCDTFSTSCLLAHRKLFASQKLRRTSTYKQFQTDPSLHARIDSKIGHEFVQRAEEVKEFSKRRVRMIMDT